MGTKLERIAEIQFIRKNTMIHAKMVKLLKKQAFRISINIYKKLYDDFRL